MKRQNRNDLRDNSGILRAFIVFTLFMLLLAILAVRADAQQPESVTIRSGYVLTVLRNEPSRFGVAMVSNSNYHMTLAKWFSITDGTIPPGKWDAELCVTVSSPTGRAPLAVQIRALDVPWDSTTSYQELTYRVPWHVRWTDGEQLRFTGPGVYCTRLGAHVDYWQQVTNEGLVILAEPGQTAGVTYSLRGDLVELRLRRV